MARFWSQIREMWTKKVINCRNLTLALGVELGERFLPGARHVARRKLRPTVKPQIKPNVFSILVVIRAWGKALALKTPAMCIKIKKSLMCARIHGMSQSPGLRASRFSWEAVAGFRVLKNVWWPPGSILFLRAHSSTGRNYICFWLFKQNSQSFVHFPKTLKSVFQKKKLRKPSNKTLNPSRTIPEFRIRNRRHSTHLNQSGITSNHFAVVPQIHS